MNFIITLSRSLLIFYFGFYTFFNVCLWITPETARYVIFQNFVKIPFRDLTDPTKYGLENVHNFYMDIEPQVRIGIWHFIPSPLEYNFKRDGQNTIKQHFEKYFRQHDNRPVVIYAHGNDRDRSANARVQLCSSLSELGYHVFAVDYRGYGDSTGSPTETGVVNDLLTLHNFIRSFQNRSRVFLWGHSLGSGIATHAAKILSEFKSPPAGLILEAPFMNISRANRQFPVTPLIMNTPWSLDKFDEALEMINLQLNNAKNLLEVNAKVLIVHAEDDWLISRDHSKELIKECELKRDKSLPAVKLIEFHKDFGLGHGDIYTHKELYPIIKEFIDN